MNPLAKRIFNAFVLLLMTLLPMACAGSPIPPPPVSVNSSMQVRRLFWKPEAVELTPAQKQIVADMLSVKPTLRRLRRGVITELDPEGRLSIVIDGTVYTLDYFDIHCDAYRAKNKYDCERWEWMDERIQTLRDQFNPLFKPQKKSQRAPGTAPSPHG